MSKKIEESGSSPGIIQKMLFGTKLQNEVFSEWRDYCMNYNHLQKLLKEGVILQNSWTEKDEQNFVSELDKELEKVYTFQSNKFDELSEMLDNLQLETETPSNKFEVAKFSAKLDDALGMANHLDQFQRLNYTGFVKIVEKHDRVHKEFSVKPLLNVRLKSLPFHSEDYSPLLYKISALFQFLRDNYDVDQSLTKLSSFEDTQQLEFQSFKFWIHPDNLMEVKTTILRHLPVLIYNNNDDYDDDENDDNNPITNCVYFDNSNFDLYNSKLTKTSNHSTLRIKWVGKLSDKPKISIEKKNFDTTADEFSMGEKLDIKEKYLDSFVQGTFKPDKLVSKLIKRGADKEVVTKFSDDVVKLSNFIKESNLQPCMRSTYKRTAFQIPGDDRIRVIIDSDLMFIREDAFDENRPIRDPSKWHRTDIDSNVANPYALLRKGEYSKFPYSVMEIKVKLNKKKKNYWVDELVESYLVKEIPNFSKFIQGVSTLFLEDENLDNIPLWYNELQSNINVDPEQAFIDSKKKTLKIQNEQENLQKFKSMLSTSNTIHPRSMSFSSSVFNSPMDSAYSPKQSISNIDEISGSQVASTNFSVDQSSDDFDDEEENPLKKIFNFPTTFSKLIDVDSEESDIELPVGVTKPESFIKNAGPLKIEPKVWLANERTFNRWLHVTTLLSSLTFVIYSSAAKSNSFQLSEILSYLYFGLTLFSGIWGYYIFMKRRDIIMERSSKHLDSIAGPLIIATGLILGLIANFVFGWKKLALSKGDGEITIAGLAEPFYQENPIHKSIHEFMFKLVGA